MTVPYYLVRVNCSRGAKTRRTSMAKKTTGKRRPLKGEARKHNQDSIELRWINDAIYRASQTKIGWTREYCRYLDYLTTIDISCCATWKKQNRYENSLVLGVNDGPHPGPLRERDDFPKTTRRLAALQREQGRVNVYSPKEEESAKDHSMKHCEQTLSGTATTGDPTGRRQHPHLQQNGGSQEKWHEPTTPRRVAQPTLVGGGMATNSFKPCRCFSCADFAYRHWRMSCTRRCVKTEHLVECTERDSDAHFSCLAHVTDHPTHMRWLEA